jgi:hypothetical protein
MKKIFLFIFLNLLLCFSVASISSSNYNHSEQISYGGKNISSNNYNSDVLIYPLSGNSSSSTYENKLGFFYFLDSTAPPAPTTVNLTSPDKEIVVLNWTPVQEAVSYKIYYAEDSTSEFTTLTETSSTGFSDTSTSKETYFKVAAVSSDGTENVSDKIIGKIKYDLNREEGGHTRNWISFPLNSSSFENASNFLEQLPNVTSITYWNASTQSAVTCNRILCPNIGCTDEACNFKITSDKMYEININGSASLQNNFSFIGEAASSSNVPLKAIPGTLNKNWIALPVRSSLTTADDLINSLDSTKISQVRFWDSQNQQIVNRVVFRPGFYLGSNFNLKAYTGYEVLSKTNFTWVQE